MQDGRLGYGGRMRNSQDTCTGNDLKVLHGVLHPKRTIVDCEKYFKRAGGRQPDRGKG